jgi:hypothetical protein
MVEFEIDGRQFRFDKLPAMQQFHVSRKIAPLIPPLLPIFGQIRKDTEKGIAVKDDFDKLAPLLQPFADGLGNLTDESSEYVFNACLGVVRYKHGENWIPLWSTTSKVVMVSELNDASLLLRLVIRVIQDSLAPFITGFLTNASEPEEASRSTPSQVEKIGS